MKTIFQSSKKLLSAPENAIGEASEELSPLVCFLVVKTTGSALRVVGMSTSVYGYRPVKRGESVLKTRIKETAETHATGYAVQRM